MDAASALPIVELFFFGIIEIENLSRISSMVTHTHPNLLRPQ